MKVYLVTSGAYSDYGVRAVFTDRKLAELYCAARDMKNDWSLNYHDIEEWDTFDSKILGDTDKVWCVWVARKNINGQWMIHFEKYALEGTELPKDEDQNIYFATYDRNEEKAEKIFHDMVLPRKTEEMV